MTDQDIDRGSRSTFERLCAPWPLPTPETVDDTTATRRSADGLRAR